MRPWLRTLAVLLALSVAAGTLSAMGATTPTTTGPVTITTATYHTGTESLDFAQTEVGQLILRELGINVQVVGKPTDVAQAVVTDMAAGLLPDISTFWIAESNPVFRTMVQGATQGQLAPLEPAIRRHSPILSWVIDRPELADELRRNLLLPQFNGQWYILPARYGIEQSWVSGYGLYIRGDVADQLRIATPDLTLEKPADLLALLRRIRDAGIKDVNGNPAFPIGSFQWDGNLFGSIGRAFDFGGSAFMGVQNGKVEPFIRTDYAWQNVLFIRQLISEGLLDPEMFTDSSPRLQEKIAQGRFVVWPMFAGFAVTEATAYVRSMLSVAPQMAYRPLGNMLNHQGNRASVIMKQMSTGLGFAVSARSDVDSVMRLLEWTNSRQGRATIYYGIQDKHWFWNDKGSAQLLPEAYTLARNDPKYFSEVIGGGVPGGMATLGFLAEVTGLDSKYDVTGTGVDDDRYYQNSPDVLDKVNVARKAVMPDQRFVNTPRLDAIFPTYPNWEQFRPVWTQMKEVMLRAYLVGTEAEARRIIEDYRTVLRNQGVDNFIAHVQSVYDKNPAAYAPYVGW